MATLCRQTISFSLLGGAEQADMSLHWFSPAGLVADLAAAINAEFNDWWVEVRDDYKTTVQVVHHRLSTVDISTGRILAAQDLNLPTNPAGLDTGKQLPLQCSPVLSLRTGLSGSSSRGRMYFPPVTTNIIDDEGYVQLVYRVNLVDATAAFITAIQAATSWDAGVFSRTNHSFTPLSAIDMGSVIDTQRRRRAELVESRYSVSI